MPIAEISKGMRNGDDFTFVFKFIVKAVFAGDERCLVNNCHIIASLRRFHQRTQHLGFAGIAPREIVQQRYLFQITADSDDCRSASSMAEAAIQ